jgi:mannose-1-phosphate guanylyltransferase
LRRKQRSHLWSVVLAGGTDDRKFGALEFVCAAHPDQNVQLSGIQKDMDGAVLRAVRLAPADQQVAVATRAAGTGQTPRAGGATLVEPCDRGSAIRFFLALSFIRQHDPDATVLVLPPRLLLYPEDQFVPVLLSSAAALRSLPERLILLGAPEPSGGAGQVAIHAGSELPESVGLDLRSVYRLAAADTSPAATRTCRLLGNTGVMVGRLSTWWEIGRRHLGEALRLLEQVAGPLAFAREGVGLESIYAVLPRLDLTTDILAHETPRLAVAECRGVLWSDGTNRDRFVATLERLVRCVAPEECWSGSHQHRSELVGTR